MRKFFCKYFSRNPSIIHNLSSPLGTEQHPARVGSWPSGAATRAFFYKTVFSKKKTVLVKSSARPAANSLE